MKWIGQHIWKFVSRFRNDVYMENIDTGTIASGGNLGLDSNNKIVKANEASGGISFDGSTANGVLTYKDSDEASVESNLTYNSETLTIGENDNGSASIIRNASNDIGGQLNLAAGSGTGTDKAGGEIHLFGGASTGVAAGGSLKFSSSVSDGSSDATGNTRTEKFEVTPEGNITIKGTIIGNSGSDNDLQISTDGSMLFTIDRDNDETSQSFAWENFSTEIMNLDESGNLQIDGGLTTGSTSFVNSSGVVQVATQGTIDHDSLANFVAAEHVDWAGSSAGTIHSSNIPTLNQDTTGNADTATALETSRNLQVDLTSTSAQGFTGAANATSIGVNGTLPVANGGTGVTSLGSINISSLNNDSGFTANTGDITGVTAGTNLSGGGSSGAVTINLADASASAKGAVELATTGEADTGTDTARAVTPAGLKSHVDARYTYQYIPLSANATTPTDGDWMYASGNGIGNHLYNQNGGAGGTTASNTDGSASTITISKNSVSGGIMVPYDSILCGFYAQTRAASNHQKAVGIFTGQPIWNDYIDITAYLRGYSAQDISAGPDTSYSVRAVQHSVLDINYSLSAGECVWFCLKDLSGSGGGVISSATIVLKTLIP